jgi:predicted KAP-like P-loop ATPase
MQKFLDIFSTYILRKHSASSQKDYPITLSELSIRHHIFAATDPSGHHMQKFLDIFIRFLSLVVLESFVPKKQTNSSSPAAWTPCT